MGMYFYLWMLMSACAIGLLIVNRKQQNVIDEYKKQAAAIANKLTDNSSDDTEKSSVAALMKNLDNLEEVLKQQDEMMKQQDSYIKKYRNEIDRLRKISADFTPMTKLSDYREKVKLLSEQAEDMFGLCINEVTLKRSSSFYSAYWDIDMKVGNPKMSDEPLKEEETA